MIIFKCKICGGALEINTNERVAVCEYCGTQQTIPRINNEHIANLYERADHYRRNHEYDKAMNIYEQILNNDSSDAECYWSVVLCRYGIEYVEDPSSGMMKPTVNRMQYTSIFNDEDYKSAIRCADEQQRKIYEKEAFAINDIQKNILAISRKETPFDIFICYKETDDSGRRTQDSVLANDLYHRLVQEGYKVFFSRITLEDKLGTAYEPYIFAALNSAKIMIVLGTKPEYFTAVWVKNEWSRFIALMKNGENKTLIPAYRDMDPYDLPEEFSHLQALDMSNLGFMQDLIRSIKKILPPSFPQGSEDMPAFSGFGNTSYGQQSDAHTQMHNTTEKKSKIGILSGIAAVSIIVVLIYILISSNHAINNTPGSAEEHNTSGYAAAAHANTFTPSPTKQPSPPEFKLGSYSAQHASSSDGVSSDTYYASHVTDKDPKTAWIPVCEDDGLSPVGHWVELISDSPQYFSGLTIVNGFAKDSRKYFNNYRVKGIKIIIDGADEIYADLADAGCGIEEYISLGKTYRASSIRIVILSVHETNPKYKEAAISEITPEL